MNRDEATGVSRECFGSSEYYLRQANIACNAVIKYNHAYAMRFFQFSSLIANTTPELFSDSRLFLFMARFVEI